MFVLIGCKRARMVSLISLVFNIFFRPHAKLRNFCDNKLDAKFDD